MPTKPPPWLGPSLAAALGCSTSPATPGGAGVTDPPAGCLPGEAVEGAGCEAAGLPLDMPCAPGELLAGGGACVPAGVPPERCPAGFVAADRGCSATLPESPCGPGTMALPGETSCRAVAPCAGGRFGRIPVEDDTQYVDATFDGVADGTADSPWTSIQQAVGAAASGAIVAIAAGSYAEHVVVSGKSVRLWGTCPEEVEIVGPATGVAAIDMIDGAHGSEVHTLAVRGARVGVGLSDALDVTIDRVWVHDTGDQGVLVDRILGKASATVTGSLIEATGLMGLIVVGGTLTLEESVVRDAGGRGVDAFASPYGDTPADVSISRVLVERTHDGGIVIAGSLAEVERVLVRDIEPDGGSRGHGVAFFDVPGMPPTHASLVDSVVERTHEAGVIGSATEVTIDGVTIRDVEASTKTGGGPGVLIDAWAGTTPLASATVRHALVERGSNLGIFVAGANAVLEGVLVRETRPGLDGRFGWGIGIQDDADDARPANAEIRSCEVLGSRDSGIFVFGSTVVVDSTAVRDTISGSSGRYGSGLSAAVSPRSGLRSSVTVHATLLERNLEAGAVVVGSDLAIDRSLIRDTSPNALGGYGDGILVISEATDGHLDLSRTRVEGSARAGVACFGGRAAIASSALACQAFALDSETWWDRACQLEDRGGNGCGCDELTDACQAVSAALEPPAPLAPPFEYDH